MDFWFFADCDADAGCFFWDDFGVDISFPSTPRTMMTTKFMERMELTTFDRCDAAS